MKTVLCSRTRPSQIGEEIYDGGFGYTLDFSWAKWPKDLEGVHTLNGCFDQKEIFMWQRRIRRIR